MSRNSTCEELLTLQ